MSRLPSLDLYCGVVVVVIIL